MPAAPSHPGRDGAAPSQGAALAFVLMAVATLCFAVMHGLVRGLSASVHPFEIAFFRNALGMLVLVPWFVARGAEPLRTRRFGLHLQRAVFNVVAMLLFFLALGLSPLATVQALGFTAPLFSTVLAVVLLKERVRRRRWSAVAVGFAGTLVIVRPGLAPLELGMLLTLASAAIWALCVIMIKWLSRTESALTITAYMVLLMTPLSLLPALAVWTWPGPVDLALLAATGIVGTVAQLLMTQALKLADTTAVLPLDFLKVVWGAAIGWLFFGETVDAWTWAGAVVIFAGASYVTVRERQVERERIREAGAGPR